MLDFGFAEEGLRLVSPPVLCMIFQEKCFSCYILLTDHNSLPDCLYFLRYWAICLLQLFVSPGCDVRNFEINLIFLIQLFLYMTKKSRQNILST